MRNSGIYRKKQAAPILLDGIAKLEYRGYDSAGISVTNESGKTTVVSLIPRFYDITSGSITINGVDIRDYRLESLRNNISFVGFFVFKCLLPFFLCRVFPGFILCSCSFGFCKQLFDGSHTRFISILILFSRAFFAQ